MPSDSNIQSPSQVQSLILKLAVSGEADYQTLSPKSLEAHGQAALALALAYGVSDPNAEVALDYKAEVQKPLLSAILYQLSAQQSLGQPPEPGSPLVDIPLDPSSPWPREAGGLAARERLALLLVRIGANPWLKDGARMDALDWAVHVGSRSLVALLLKHPECPPLKELQKRTLHVSARRVPWLHFSANKNRRELFFDLLNHGLDPTRLDNQGWSVAAWAGSPEILREILPTQPKDELSKHQEVILEAWAQRSARNQGPYFKHEEMIEVLSETSTLDTAAMDEAELGKIAEKFLAARATTYYSSDLSFNPHASSKPGAADRIAKVYAHMDRRFDWRIEKKTGVNKGRWSLMSAAMWAVFFGERGLETSRDFLAKGIESILSGKSQQELDDWLKEEVRPGLTNQGMAGLVLFNERWPSVRGKEDMGFLFGSLRGAEGYDSLLRSTLQAAVSIAKGQSSKQAKDEVSSSLSKILTGIKKSGRSMEAVLPVLPDLMNGGLFRPSSPQYGDLATLAINAIGRGEGQEEKKVGIRAALALTSFPSSMIPGITQANEPQIRSRMFQNRDRLARAVMSALQRDPGLALAIDADNYPFAKEKLINTPEGPKDPNRNLPSPAEWTTSIQQLQMEDQIPDSPGSSTPSPARMRF